ncbi:MAG: sigma-70 family RNA polymerase sigma factor [Planctomycetaceae bacterium]
MNTLSTEETELIEDAELLRRVVEEQNSAALEMLIRRHSRLVMGIVRQKLFRQEDAEEAFQSTFVKLIEQSQKIRNREALPAWLMRVARNEAHQLLRGKQRTPVHSTPETLEQTVMASENKDVQHDLQVLLDEVDQLPENFQPAVILCYLEGKTQEEAARQLGLTSAAVKGRLERGRKLLKERLLKRGVGMAVLVSSWQANQAGAAGMVTAALVQQTAQVCMSSVVLTVGSAAVATSTLSKGAVLMSIAGSKKVIVGVALGLLMIGGGTTYVVSSISNQTIKAPAEREPDEPQPVVTAPVEAQPATSGLSKELQELVEKVKEQETLYDSIEMKSVSDLVFHNPLAQPQPGFDVNPYQPTGNYQNHEASQNRDGYDTHSHHGRFVIHDHERK